MYYIDEGYVIYRPNPNYANNINNQDQNNNKNSDEKNSNDNYIIQDKVDISSSYDDRHEAHRHEAHGGGGKGGRFPGGNG